MSFPEIADGADLTLENAISLLLKSVAEEEISISKLLDAEKNKILHILNSDKISPRDLIEINGSVDQTVKDIIKLQMLLQFKLDNINKILPYLYPLPCPEADCEEIKCCLNCLGCKVCGNTKGGVTDGFNEFFGRCAAAEFNADENDLQKAYVSYTISGGCPEIAFKGNVRNMSVSENTIILKGEGKCVYKNGERCAEGCARYILMINCRCGNIKSFDIIISAGNPLLQHRSGIVTAAESDLQCL